MSERVLKILRKSGDFQAEYEGSIPHHPPNAFAKARPAKFASDPGKKKMAEADLDVVIRSLGKTQHKALTDAAKKRHARLMGLAAKAKDKEAKARYKQLAKSTLVLAGAAARRLQITAENAADSYVRSIQKAADEKPAKKPVKKGKG
jgi:hypothetical protein